MQDNKETWRKVELRVKYFKIDLKLNVDCNLFSRQTVDGVTHNESWELVNYLSSKIKGFRGLFRSYKQLEGKLPFKGAETVENKQ